MRDLRLWVIATLTLALGGCGYEPQNLDSADCGV